MNFLITLRCPKKCSFCFSDKINSDMPFEKFRDYVDRTVAAFPDHDIGILGGEPTVHPDFARMLHYALTRRTAQRGKVKVVVFTNLLGSAANIAALDQKFRTVSNLAIVWNGSELGNLSPKQQELVIQRARSLHKAEPKKITYSITYTPYADLGYLTDVMEKTGIRGARFAVSAGLTDQVAADDAIATHLVRQLEMLARHGMLFYFDECGAVSARMRPELLARLAALSVTRSIHQCPGPLTAGHCDILPDGSMIPCMPFLATPTAASFDAIENEAHLSAVMRAAYPALPLESEAYDLCDAYRNRPAAPAPLAAGGNSPT